ncbi:MAG: endonuclease domain-containing protein [Variovorax sp.]|uniref:Endonuclease domain-containing protein n=1 Tax=Variovorax guangxiensis TaxID=1775474 RepID=A0A502DTL2_9BURK|nr:endonuclease domain-containing protein [Variovorax guangxiensis]RZI91807.1 MAG: endonuclease domain-containing protein [Variovorax sp.]TPG24508.1 endonuclease domain-containing protein [Variovorax ginsengisoli]TPG28758.1 endonuclease domain-containing protein [Variovorax guangxiensis]
MSVESDPSGPLSRVRERARVRARSLRKDATDAESLLWFHLRDRRLGNHKFRRQRPIGPYFADFACLEAKLIVELDGGQHVEAVDYDETRTGFMVAQGFRVLRFWNNEVLAQTSAVLERILQALQEDPHPNPLPQAGEGARQDTRNITP